MKLIGIGWRANLLDRIADAQQNGLPYAVAKPLKEIHVHGIHPSSCIGSTLAPTLRCLANLKLA